MSFLKMGMVTESLKPEGDSSVGQVSKERKSFFRVSFYIFFAGLMLLPVFLIPSFGFSLELVKILFLGCVVGLSIFLWIVAQLREGVFSIPRSLLLFLGFLALGDTQKLIDKVVCQILESTT